MGLYLVHCDLREKAGGKSGGCGKNLEKNERASFSNCGAGGQMQNRIRHLARGFVLLHGNERAFAEGAEPGLLPACELPRPRFDAIDTGSQGRGGHSPPYFLTLDPWFLSPQEVYHLPVSHRLQGCAAE
jgi:hypothetical protein